MKAPAFQFYPRDFLVGVTGLSNEQTGILIKLLCLQWERGSLPIDHKALQRMVGRTTPIPEVVMVKFKVQPNDTMINERLELVRAEQQKFHDRQKANAQKRWNKPADPTAMPPHPSGISQTHPLQSASAYCNSIHTHHANESELPTEPQAIAIGANAGVPEAFSKLVFSEWFERQGHYRDGPVPFSRRLMGRWTRERAQWDAGTHSSQRGLKTYASNSQKSRTSTANARNSNRNSADQY